MSSDMKKKIMKYGIIAIGRRLYGEDLLHVVDAMYEGGIRLMEITFDQSDPDCIQKTTEAISAASARCPEMAFGAGTVLTVQQVCAAHEAGGRYIISPNTCADVIHATKELGMVSIPGAMTPSEIVAAHQAGADLVKLFPASWLGASYMKSITSPISHIPLLATGGVSLENFGEFLEAGCCGAGVGGPLLVKSMIQNKDWAGLADHARKYVELFNRVKHP